jgi:hypothetical protein
MKQKASTNKYNRILVTNKFKSIKVSGQIVSHKDRFESLI